MRISSALILVGAFGLILYAGWHRRSPNQMDVAFNSGGKVALDLSAGGYTVRGTTENRVRVEVDPSDARNVQCRINVSGSNAKVELEGPSQNFHATIYVPQRSDLQVDQTIGDLRIGGVEGNKDLRLNIGKIEVEVPTSGLAPSFEGSVIIGALRATTWHVEKGGFFREFTMHSSGPYWIRAHVDIGDLALLDFTPQVGSSHAEQSGDADDDVSDQDSENDSE